MQQDAGWLISLAPASSCDLFIKLCPSEGVLLADRPAALLGHSDPEAAIDLDALADRLSGSVTLEGKRTLYHGIFRIAGGEEVRVRDGQLSWHRWWQPPRPSASRSLSVQAAADRLRELAEAVVDRHLPDDGKVAVQLSGGRDSSLLCALAAKRLASRGQSLLALTALPCEGLPQASERHQYDESAGAIATARRYDNVEHLLLRPRPLPLASFLDLVHRQLGEPLHQPISLTWCLPQLERCAERNIGLLLTGDDGNFTVSAGGLPHLTDLWREEGAGVWLRSVKRLLGEGGVTVRDVVRLSIGARLPLPLYRAARKRGQPPLLFKDYPFFTPPLRNRLLALTPDSDDPRPVASHRDLVERIAGNLFNLLAVGRYDHAVEMLAPWDDRALFELMLSMPSSLLASPPDRRTLFDRAFGDLLPKEVLRPVRRGRQNVDFHAGIDRADLVAAVARYRQSAQCRELVDVDALARAAADWPSERDPSPSHYDYWVGQFLPALSLASFLFTRDEAVAA